MTEHRIGAPRHHSELPKCPGCGRYVDVAGEQEAIAWVGKDSVLWHAACIENHEVAEMKDDPFSAIDVPFTDESNA